MAGVQCLAVGRERREQQAVTLTPNLACSGSASHRNRSSREYSNHFLQAPVALAGWSTDLIIKGLDIAKLNA